VTRPSEISTRKDLKLETFWRIQKSHLVRNMLNTAAYFALSDLSIRIVGEKGSGKLHLARLIHQYSSRENFSFTHIDCSQPDPAEHEIMLFGSEDRDGRLTGDRPGLLDSPDEGTIYLDMLSALPAVTQTNLFRALEMMHFRRIGGTQDVHLSVRIITGHIQSRILEQTGWRAGSNLPAHVSPVCINIPPLRERREDIEPLVYLFLDEYSKEIKNNVTQITSEALDICRYYSWPGNVYELRNVIRHSALRCRNHILDPVHLPEYIRQDQGTGEINRLAETSRRYR